MNSKRSNKSSDKGGFRVRLGLTQTVIFLGLILGSLTGAFFLGFRSGQMERFDEIAAIALEKIPRLPISADEKAQQVPKRLVSEVYAKLQDSSPADGRERKALGDLSAQSRNAKDASDEMKPVKVLSIPKPTVKTLGDTLGDIDPKKSPDVKKVTESKVDTPEKPTQIVKASSPKSSTLGGLFELSNSARVKSQQKEAKVESVKLANANTNTVSDVMESKELVAPPVKKASVNTAPVESKRELVSQIAGGWYVQLAALEDAAASAKLLDTLKKNGFLDAIIQTAGVSGKTYHRVLVGPEENALLAKRLRDQLEREPYVTYKPYLKKIP